MPRLEVPKIVRPLALRAYVEEFGEDVIHVWVNPPRDLWRKYDSLMEGVGVVRAELKPDLGEEEVRMIVARLSELGHEIQAWYAEIWSQGPVGTTWKPEEVDELIAGVQDTDPALWPWLSQRTLDLIVEHRNRSKKG